MDPIDQSPYTVNSQDAKEESSHHANSVTQVGKHTLEGREDTCPAIKPRTFKDLTRARNILFTINFNTWLLQQDLSSLDAAFFSELNPAELDPSVLTPLSRMALRRAFLLLEARTVEQFKSFLPSLCFFQGHHALAETWLNRQIGNLADSSSSIKPLLQALAQLPPGYKIQPYEEKKLLRAVVQQSKTDKIISIRVPSIDNDEENEMVAVKIGEPDRELLSAWLALGEKRRFASSANDCIDAMSHLFYDWFFAIEESYNWEELRPFAELLAILFKSGILPRNLLCDFEKCIPPQLERGKFLLSLHFIRAVRPEEEDLCKAYTLLLKAHFREDPEFVKPFFEYEDRGNRPNDAGDQELYHLQFNRYYFNSRFVPTIACELLKMAINLESKGPLIHLLGYLANVASNWDEDEHDPLPWPMIVKTIIDYESFFTNLADSDVIGLVWLLMYSTEEPTAKSEQAFLSLFIRHEDLLRMHFGGEIESRRLSWSKNCDHYRQLLQEYLDQRQAIHAALKRAVERPDLPVEGMKDLKATPVTIEPLSLLIALETKAENYNILPLLTNFPRNLAAVDTLKLLERVLKSLTICDAHEITLDHLRSIAHLINYSSLHLLVPLLALRRDLFEQFTQWMRQPIHLPFAAHDLCAIPFWAKCFRYRLANQLPPYLLIRISQGREFDGTTQEKVLLMCCLTDILRGHDIAVSDLIRTQLSQMLKSDGLNDDERSFLDEAHTLLTGGFRMTKLI